ncbi:MAG: PAS domain S-box protein [Desulfobacterales bacterium]|nr:PAS domain S-box protein [Desulfobacterales bacterium]
MINRMIRRLTVGQRIFGGFVFFVILFGMMIPLVLKDHVLLLERIEQVSNVDKKADRLLLISSKRIESSRVNLMRFLRDYLPNTQESLNDIIQASQFLSEAENLIVVEEQKNSVMTVIKMLMDYKSIIHQIGVQIGEGKDFETNRLVFTALKTGNDISFQIEDIVEKNDIHVLDENKIADMRFKKNLWFLVAYCLGALILSLIMAALVGRSITKPVAQLREGAEFFRQGHTDFVLEFAGTDELSLLAITFNQMAANLHQNKISLQERADALEKELFERKKAEEELHQYQTKLEELVENRTSELSKTVEQLSSEVFERKRAEKAIKENEKRVRIILDSISAGIIVIDPQNRSIVDVNPVTEKMIGLSRDEIIGRRCHEFICPRTLNDCPIIDLKQRIDNAERVLITAEGKSIPILKTVTPIVFGEKDYLLESFVDLTERKRIEEILRESQQRLSLLIQSSPLGVIEFDIDFRIIAWNPAAERIFGYSRDESTGSHGTVLIPEEIRPHVDMIWKELLEKKGGERSINDNLTKDGRRIICEWHNIPLINESGSVIGIASLVDDITFRKQAELELKQYVEDLEKFNRLTISREERMIQLKEEINTLLETFGKQKKYKVVE